MQQAEIVDLFRPILQQSAQRRRITDYAGVALLIIFVAAWGWSIWRNNQVPQITSIALVPNSVMIIGPADSVNQSGDMEFCPGDMMTVRYALAIEGEGVIYADDSVDYQDNTVKFSSVWRAYAKEGIRTYENPWQIPARPEMSIDGRREWMAGEYVRIISIAPSNIYISRYVPAETFEIRFTMKDLDKDDCP